MRNKMKWFLPISALLALVPWPVTHAYAYINEPAGQNDIRIEVIEASAAGSVVTEDAITTLEKVLPSHVYVLNGREIVTEKTWNEMNKSQDPAEELPSDRRTASPSGTIIKASFTVTPARLIAVDQNDRIIEIWSNTTGTKRDFYSLRVKEKSLRGSEHPLTQDILAQYNRLLREVDWTGTGQVYAISMTDYAN